jgi:hypothetical protein
MGALRDIEEMEKAVQHVIDACHTIQILLKELETKHAIIWNKTNYETDISIENSTPISKEE